MKSVLKIVGLLALVILFSLSTVEFFTHAPVGGRLLGKLTLLWTAAWFFWLLVCISFIILAAYFAFSNQGSDRSNMIVAAWRSRIGKWGWAVVFLFATIPAIFFLFTRWGAYFETPAIRLSIALFSGLGIALSIPSTEAKGLRASEIVLGFLISSSFFLTAKQLVGVTNFPFSLGWSEGNRLYDYSVILGRNRYIYPGLLQPVRREIGRLLLWGIPYLIPGSPIWLHRFWNVFLGVLPPLLLGYLIIRPIRLPQLALWSFVLWVYLFIWQGPIYTPLVISAVIIVLFVKPGKLVLSLIAVAAASYYATSSRFTWLPAAPAWAGILLLVGLELPTIEDWKSLKQIPKWGIGVLRHLSPVILVVGVGIAGGVLANPLLVSPNELAGTTVSAQPLLWYRLFPNVNNPAGIIGALLFACVPLSALLIYLVVTRRWILSGLQKVGYLFVYLVFLIGGIIASVKIGGGNNLHNMDMFLITLMILSGLAIREMDRIQVRIWPLAAQLLLILTIFLPVLSAYQGGSKLELPSEEVVQKALAELQVDIQKASEEGEVLFMDQRQLLTFGFINGVTLVPEYEKKYMMDKAMASNQEYFNQFYNDLTEHRFTMIITDPLFTKIKESDYKFAEENNAWVRWVAIPLLCYYTPVRNNRQRVLDEFDIQLLKPRSKNSECPPAKP